MPIAAALRERPGAWALIHKGDASFAHHIKTARSKSFAPAGSFEATARSNEDGTCDIYARFVGEGGAS